VKHNAAILGREVSALAVFLSAFFLAPSASNAALTEFFSATGRLSISVDAIGSNNASHDTQVEKPSALATVRKAYVMAASYCGANSIPDNSVSINGTPIAWDESVPNSFFFNVRADVTSIVKPVIDASPAGTIDFTFAEVPANNVCIDGEILVVVFDDPAQTRDTTIILLFGGQALTGDTFAITLAEPIDPSSAGALADMGLGISFGFQPSSQFSIVNVGVNGERLSTSAGGQDDGGGFNGGLITVGGLGDSNANPSNPNGCGPPDPAAPRCDDELYSLLDFLGPNVTRIEVFTQNPSNDDNIFFAWFHLSGAAVLGEGIVLSPPEASNPVGTQHTVTAKVVDDDGNPVQGRLVTFNVVSGPNQGDNGTDTTDANGEATFTYTGDGGPGEDTIEASFVDSQENTQTSNTVTKVWTGELCDGEGPCLIVGAPEDEEYIVGGRPSPGIKVHVTTAGAATLRVIKTLQAVVRGPCEQSLESSNQLTFEQMIDPVTGAVLTTKEVKALQARIKKLKKLSAAKRQALLLAAANGSGDFDVKVGSLHPDTLEIAEQHGCRGVALLATFRIDSLDPLGRILNTVEGSATREWLFE
jgi:hypothetical protein